MEKEILEQSSVFISKELMLIAVAILLLINIIAFVLMGIDKKRSKHHSRKNDGKEPKKKSKHHRKSRIPEAVLLGLAVCGGGFGILLGMIAFHHKTNSIRHPAFVNGVPIILLVELICALFVFASMI